MIFYVVTILSIILVSSPALAEVLKIKAGGTAISTVFAPVKEHFEKDTGHKLDFVQTSAVKALIELDKGSIDAAAGAHPLDDLVAGAMKEGVKIDKNSIVSTLITDNKTIAFVHIGNPVTTISKDQLKNIFTGKITNWKDIGGNDQKILVVWGKETEGQNIQFKREILDGETLAENLITATDYRNIRDTVIDTPGAIGIGPYGMNSVKLHTPKIPTIASPVYLFTKGTPTKNIQLILDFYKKEYGFLD